MNKNIWAFITDRIENFIDLMFFSIKNINHSADKLILFTIKKNYKYYKYLESFLGVEIRFINQDVLIGNYCNIIGYQLSKEFDDNDIIYVTGDDVIFLNDPFEYFKKNINDKLFINTVVKQNDKITVYDLGCFFKNNKLSRELLNELNLLVKGTKKINDLYINQNILSNIYNSNPQFSIFLNKWKFTNNNCFNYYILNDNYETILNSKQKTLLYVNKIIDKILNNKTYNIKLVGNIKYLFNINFNFLIEKIILQKKKINFNLNEIINYNSFNIKKKFYNDKINKIKYTEYENVIIIPYRNRKRHLDYFIKNTVPLINKIVHNSKVVIVEQNDDKPFNRGYLINVAFNEYRYKTKYFIFCDVDINPQTNVLKTLFNKEFDENSILGILTSVCDTLSPIVKIHSNTIHKINGFPNNLWGWGAEDKDIQNRSEFFGIKKIVNHINAPTPNKVPYIIVEKKLLYNYNNLYIHFDDIKDRDKIRYFSNKEELHFTIYPEMSRIEKKKYVYSSGLNLLKYNFTIKKYNTIDHLNIDLYESCPLINILTRTGSRPTYFKNMVNSLKQQSYTNYNHIISNDKINCEYLNDYKNVNFIDNKLINYMEGFYNLYLDKLIKKCYVGWVIIIDDDSKFIKNNFLEKLAEEIEKCNKNDILIYQSKVDKNILPSNDDMRDKYIRYWGIDMSCFCVHNYVLRDNTFSSIVKNNSCKYADYKILKKLENSKKYKFKFIDLPIGIWANYDGQKLGK